MNRKRKVFFSIILSIMICLSTFSSFAESGITVFNPIMNSITIKKDELKEENKEFKERKRNLENESKLEINNESAPVALMSYRGAYTTTPEDFIYRGDQIAGLTDAGLRKVNASSEVNFVIPERGTSGQIVRGIENAAFYSEEYPITSKLSVTIPENITVVGDSSFLKVDVEELYITSKSGLEIQSNAFAGCNIEKLNIENIGNKPINIQSHAFLASAGNNNPTINFSSVNEGINIESSAFYNGENKDNLILVNRKLVKFNKNDNLGYKTVNLNGAVRNIGKLAFFKNKIENLNLLPGTNSGLTNIDGWAFAGANISNDIDFTGNNNLTQIGEGAFLGSTGKEEKENSIIIKDCNSLEKIGIMAFSNTSFNGDVILENLKNLKIISDSAFYNGDTIVSTTGGDGEELDEELNNFYKIKANEETIYFKGRLVLKNLPMLNSIGLQAFSHNSRLPKYKVDSEGNYIEENGARVIRDFSLKESRGTNNDYGFSSLAFEDLNSLETVKMWAFMDNNFNSSIDLSKNATALRTIGQQAFCRSGLNGLLKINDNLETIGLGGFFDTPIEEVQFGQGSLKDLGYAGFSGTKINKDIVIKNMPFLKTIAQSAFQFAGDEENPNVSIIIENNPSLKSIGTRAFNGAYFKGDLTIKDNKKLEEIEDAAFYNAANSKNSIRDVVPTSFKKGDGTNDGLKSLVIKDNPNLKVIGKLALSNHSFKGSLDLRSNPIETLGEFALSFNGFSCIDLPGTVEKVLGMDGKDKSAFTGNNQEFKGINENSKELIGLPIFVANKDTPLESILYYTIRTTGACSENGTLTVKVLNSEGKKEDDLKDVVIKLVKIEEDKEKEKETKTGSSEVEFTLLNPSDKYKVYIENVPEKYDTSEILKGVDVPEFVDNKALVEIKLPSKLKNITVKYLEQGTNRELKKSETIENKLVGEVINITIPNIAGYKKVSNDETVSYTVTANENIVTIYYSNNRVITVTKKHDGDEEPMPCIKYGVYKKSDDTLVGEFTTDENGKGSLVVDTNEALYIKELGIDNKCNKCKINGSSIECKKKYDKYVPNKKIVEVPPNESIEVIFHGYEVTLVIPETGTLGMLPYIIGAIIVLLVAFLFLKKKKKKEEVKED